MFEFVLVRVSFGLVCIARLFLRLCVRLVASWLVLLAFVMFVLLCCVSVVLIGCLLVFCIV